MVGNVYEMLLSELAKAMDIKELRPDQNNTCLIKFPTGLEVQIEPFRKGEELLIVINLGKIPPGRYREDVFLQALIANGQPWPRRGVFCYSDQSDQLLLFKLMPYKDLNGERIASFLTPFVEKGEKWKESLVRGEVPVAATFTGSRRAPGPFGLM
jgi:hypothetical protein